jgi:hypothetical protein
MSMLERWFRKIKEKDIVTCKDMHGHGRPLHLAKHKRTRGWLLDHAHNQGEGVQEMLMVGLVMF